MGGGDNSLINFAITSMTKSSGGKFQVSNSPGEPEADSVLVEIIPVQEPFNSLENNNRMILILATRLNSSLQQVQLMILLKRL